MAYKNNDMNNQYWLFGTHLTILEEADHSEGRYDLISGVFAPGIETPLHVHRKYSESIYVISGLFNVYMEGETHNLNPGEHLFIPIGVPHSIACIGNQSGTALTIASPSGFASLVRQVGLPGKKENAPDDLPDMALFKDVSESIGDAILGPPGYRIK